MDIVADKVVADRVVADRVAADMVLVGDNYGFHYCMDHNYIDCTVNYTTYLILYIVIKNTLHAIKIKI